MEIKKFISELPTLKVRQTSDAIASFDCSADELITASTILRDKFNFESLNDIAAVDYGEELLENRYGAVYHFYSHANKEYASLRVICKSVDEPKIPSLCSVYKGADWLERECFDMMGIVFEGHPRLARILMWDNYPYYPLRKDFPLAGKEAPLPPSFEGNENATKVEPAPEEGGPFHSPSYSTDFCAEKEPRSVE